MCFGLAVAMQLAIFSKWSYPRGVLFSRPDAAPEVFCVVSEAFLCGSVDVLVKGSGDCGGQTFVFVAL